MIKAVVTVVLVSAGVWAQPGPGGPPPQLEEIKAHLDLSDDQVRQLRDVMRQQMENLRPRHQEMAAKHRQIDEMARTRNADPAAIGRAYLELEAMRRQMETAQRGLREETGNVLTPAQHEKLKALAEAARLAPAIQQAVQLHLVEPPIPAGRGPVPMGAPGGPGMMRRPPTPRPIAR